MGSEIKRTTIQSNTNIKARLETADAALAGQLAKLDKAVDKKLGEAADALDKAGADVARARAERGDLAEDMALVGAATVLGAIDTGAGIGHAAKGAGYGIAGVGGKIADGVRHALASAMAVVGKAFLQGSSATDGRSFTVEEFRKDPGAQSWSDKMFAKSLTEFSKSGQSFKLALADVAAAGMGTAMAVADTVAAAKYLAAAAGHTLEAAKDTGEAAVIASAEKAVELAKGVVQLAESGATRAADGLESAGMALLNAQNRVNTAKQPDYEVTRNVGY